MNYCQFRILTIKRMANAGATPILPPEYQQVEYLESSGTQYMFIGKLYNYTYFDLDFAYVSWVNNRFGQQYNFNGLIGCNNISVSGKRVDTKANFSSTPSIGGSVCNAGFTRVNITAGVKYKLYMSSDIVTLDGVTLSTSTAGQITGDYNCALFSCYPVGENTNNLTCAARVYRLQSNYTDLYPCYRVSDNKPGMYDVNNDVFYTNAGTGEFTVGNNVL